MRLGFYDLCNTSKIYYTKEISLVKTVCHITMESLRLKPIKSGPEIWQSVVESIAKDTPESSRQRWNLVSDLSQSVGIGLWISMKACPSVTENWPGKILGGW